MGFTTLLVPKEALKASGIKAGVRFAGVGSVAEALFLGLEPKRKGMDTAEEELTRDGLCRIIKNTPFDKKGERLCLKLATGWHIRCMGPGLLS